MAGVLLKIYSQAAVTRIHLRPRNLLRIGSPFHRSRRLLDIKESDSVQVKFNIQLTYYDICSSLFHEI